jgi:3-carboxy-cis,cis-muconate cycloisomerase
MTFSALDSALLGPLFATSEMAALFSDRARVAAMLRTEAALARAQAASGLVPPELAATIEAISADDLDLAALGAETAIAGVPVIPFVKAVQKRLPPGLEPFFHLSATTQDIADTALALVQRDAFGLIAAELVGILDGLSKLADVHRETACIGRTYGQHAAPVSFGFKIAVRLAGILDVVERLPDLRRRICASSGGPVGTLSGAGEHAPAVAAAFARDLGLGMAPIAWHTRRAVVAETGTWLAMLAGALSAFAADVADLVSTETGEAAEPHVPGRGGSSAMPHKRNPVSATVILAAATTAPGLAATLLSAMTTAHERPAGAWHAEWHALPQLFGLLSGALAEARRLAEGLEIDAGRMADNMGLTRGLIFADAVAARLAPAIGRAEAHRVLEKAAAEVRRSGRSLAEILAATELPDTVRRDALTKAFDPGDAVRAAGRWVDPVLAETRRVRGLLTSIRS